MKTTLTGKIFLPFSQAALFRQQIRDSWFFASKEHLFPVSRSSRGKIFKTAKSHDLFQIPKKVQAKLSAFDLKLLSQGITGVGPGLIHRNPENSKIF